MAGLDQAELVPVFQYLTKAFWLLAQPVSVIAMLLLFGLLAGLLKWRRTGVALSALALLLLGLCAYTTFGAVLIQPLEARFERPAEEPASVTGIVVLGGGMDAAVNSVRRGFELDRSGDRMVEALRLALRHPEAKVLFTGGVGVMAPEAEPETAAAVRMFTAFGISEDRLILESQARDTLENAEFSKVAARPQPGETWLLVTSAFHMPRSVALFRRAGFAVVPWPTDYLASGTEQLGIKLVDIADNIATTSTAVREWAGLLGYYVTGKIDELLPGP